MEYWSLFKYCFSWLKTPEGRKQALFLFALMAITNVILAGLFAAVGIPLDNTELQDVSVMQMVVSVAAILASVVVMLYAYAWITLEVLKQKGFGNERLDARKFLGYCWTNVVLYAYAFFSLKNLKLITIPIVGVILFALGETTGIMQIAGIALLSVYALVFAYNIIRVAFGDLVYLSKKTTAKDSVEESYNLTAGKAWFTTKILTVVLAASLIASLVVGMAFGIPLVVFTIAYRGVETTAFSILMLTALVSSVKYALVMGAVTYGGVYAYKQLLGEKNARTNK